MGDEVFEGQVLARVGSSGLETAREQASAAVDGAQQQVSTAEAGVNAARMESSRADADLQRARLQMDRAQKVFERQSDAAQGGRDSEIEVRGGDRRSTRPR